MLIKNRYEIIHSLGKGGFGKTFLAKDIDWRDRFCVIKQLTVAEDHADFAYIQDKFRQEAKVLDDLGDAIDQIPALRHQIPKLYAYFTEANLFYLVQQWIPGKTLEEQVKAELLNEKQLREFLVDILPVLQMIHERGIIHRDIKPANLIIREADGKPVLIDFGAVKELAEIAANPDTHLHPTSNQIGSEGTNKPSTIIGTPGFMAPEQETCGPVSPSTDLYSLGITAIYALSRQIYRWNYTGKSNWKQISGQLSEGLSVILEKSIQLDPGDRYRDAQEMLEALQSLPPLPDTTPETIKIARTEPVSVEMPRQITATKPLNFRLIASIVVGAVVAIIAGYSYSNYRVAQANLKYQKAQADLQKIEDLKEQGNHQACVIEAKQFTQSHTVSHMMTYFNPTAEAEQLGKECANAIVKNIATIKAKGDHAGCITEAERLMKSHSTPYANAIAEAERLKKECTLSAELQAYLRKDVLKLLEKNNQSASAEVIAKIQPSVQVEGEKIRITYDGSSASYLVENAGIQRLAAFFVSALCGQTKEFPTTKYADFSSLLVSPRGKSIVATVMKEKWDSYFKEYNQASSETVKESIKQRFIEQIQVSTP
jgi:serine/threonine-protein kinase